MFKKIFFIAGLLCLRTFIAISQDEPVFNVPSPNSQSLQVFGSFPASDYTGVPPINVPLYTLKYAGITVPISLNYNSNLVKPDLHPGWVGLGWNLSAGGSITRVVNGQPDDLPNYYTNDLETTNDNKTGLFFHFADLAGTSWNSTAQMENLTNDWYNFYQNFRDNHGNSAYWLYEANPHTIEDYEPDEFSFSFLGYSGKFYLDETGNWKVQSDQNFKVKVSTTMTKCVVTGYPNLFSYPGFSQFTITDNKGVQYVFGGNNAVEYSNNLFTRDVVPYVAKTWNLTQIILPNLETINFAYDQGPLIAALVPRSLNTQQATNELGQIYNTLSGIEFNGSVIVPSYLKSISTNLQTINFYHSPSTEYPYSDNSLGFENTLNQQKVGQWQAQLNESQNFNVFEKIDNSIQFSLLTDLSSLSSCVWHKLDRIDVIDANNNLYNRIDFNYTNDIAERLKLLTVTKSSPLAGQANGGGVSICL